jgi:hypothetical protein
METAMSDPVDKQKMAMSYDPNLRAAMAEIRIIMGRRKIGGVVVLGSKTHCEFAQIEPEWCTIRMGKNGVFRMRIPGKSDPELANASLGHVYNMRDLLARYACAYMDLVDEIDKQTGGAVEHHVITNDDILWHDGTKNKPS